MKRRAPLGALLAATLSVAGFASPAAAKSSRALALRPNILLIVADDLGWSDLGAFGGEIETPNLDRLAESGLRFTGFHTAPACSPTRAMLLTGMDSHRAGLGTMAEMTVPSQRGKPGYEGYLRSDAVTLAERLRASGYRTLFSGKWHLGLAPEQDPVARGFDRSFALLQASHNHFGLGPSQDRSVGPAYTEDGKPVTNLPADFYSSDFFASKLIAQLQASSREHEGQRPFFAYLAFTAPHFPLQAPPGAIAKYRGRYDAGFEVLRERRLRRQERIGLLPRGTLAHEPHWPKGGWNSLSAEEKSIAARDMEIYAGMVDRMDQNVGRVIAELRRSGELDNTVILFLSDNGAEGLDMNDPTLTFLKARLDKSDNNLANRGSATSFLSYGPGWAQAATAPSWSYKGQASEGGTRTPGFISWKGLARRGIGKAFLSAADIAPTLLELAGAPPGGADFAGKRVRPITGRSWVPYLSLRTGSVHGPRDWIGTELGGSRSIRQGAWKITDIGDGRWRLFDLSQDPGETRDLAHARPAKLHALTDAWASYARDFGVVYPIGEQK